MKRFISWRRVSTKKQGSSGLGLEAQRDIIDYFVKSEGGELIADFCEVYTGTELTGCTELRKAIKACKDNNAILIIAKTDRFRNLREALEILDEVGEDKIMFCDLPHTDRFTLTLFLAIAEREALLISIRTKAALKAKKERGEPTGGACRKMPVDMDKVRQASCARKREDALNNANNKAFWEFITDYQLIHGTITANTDFTAIAVELNKRGKKTARGLEFDKNRARAMYYKLKNMMI